MERKEFIIEHLRKEWEVSERMVRREDLVRQIKSGGVEVGKWLLILLLSAGALTVAAVVPNIFSAFGRMRGRRVYKTYIRKDDFEKEAKYFKRRKYINFVKKGEGEYEVDLTDFGERQIVKRAFGELKIPEPDKWDGLWRIVIFDIPDKDKSAREGLRERLKAMGFYPLQKSVFVFPYPCEEEIRFLSYIYNTGDRVRYIETPIVRTDLDLRKHYLL